MIARAAFSGLTRTLRLWKAVLAIWFLSVLVTSLVVIPVKSAFKSVLGSSMITEKLAGGIIAEIIPDLGNGFSSLLSSFSAGLFFLVLVWFFINVFLTGGLFGCLRRDQDVFTLSGFFKEGARNFSSFLVIMLVMNLVIFLAIVILFIIPSLIAAMSDSVTEKGVYLTILICGILAALLVIVFLIITDYARAWQAGRSSRAPFRAIAFGFRQAFRIFPASYLFMMMVVIMQFMPVLLSYKFISSRVPGSLGGIFLFLLVSQSLFFIKIALRTWRYAGITILMEQNEAVIRKAAPADPGVPGDIPGINYEI